eukprot:6078579-Pleurochrysis_carterae.AAC.1
MEATLSQDSFPASATGLNFPRETPNKIELKKFLEAFQDALNLAKAGTKKESAHTDQRIMSCSWIVRVGAAVH